jgi:uncharacterized caspase-like protein
VFLNESSIDTLSEGTAISSGTLIAFATGPGSIALDGTNANSPFAAALLRHLAIPGLEVNSLFNRVRQDVVRQTRGEQLPWSQSAMVGDLFLNGAPEISAPPPRRMNTLHVPPR